MPEDRSQEQLLQDVDDFRQEVMRQFAAREIDEVQCDLICALSQLYRDRLHQIFTAFAGLLTDRPEAELDNDDVNVLHSIGESLYESSLQDDLSDEDMKPAAIVTKDRNMRLVLLTGGMEKLPHVTFLALFEANGDEWSAQIFTFYIGMKEWFHVEANGRSDSNHFTMTLLSDAELELTDSLVNVLSILQGFVGAAPATLS